MISIRETRNFAVQANEEPEVAGVMKNMILVDLYTDGADGASQTNQKLEEEGFHTVAIPFYVLYDPNQTVVATFPGLTRKSDEYLRSYIPMDVRDSCSSFFARGTCGNPRSRKAPESAWSCVGAYLWWDRAAIRSGSLC